MKSFPGDKTYSKSSNPEFQKMASRYCPALTSEISILKDYIKSEKEDLKTEKKYIKTEKEYIKSEKASIKS